MCTQKISVLMMAILLAGYAPATAQKENKKDEQFKEMTALVEGGRYIFTVRSVQPTGGRSISTTSAYTLEARDSTFKAYLPYFGRSYQSSYGGDGGIEFDARAENLKLSLNEKKRMVSVQFDVRGERDRYSLFLSVGSSGYASLSINSQNRQPISYQGLVSPLKEEN